ncbi:hypothetical protein LG288_11315 [Idiomarina seosinensis]|uniref:hypothetical protein n=1 Tax=Idiomarina seosinensis TaxID=281739 RepID=UPI00384BD8E4
MATPESQMMAVDRLDETWLLLKLKRVRNKINVGYFATISPDQTVPDALPCTSLMTVMEHRAVHYQQLTQAVTHQQIQESVVTMLGAQQQQSAAVAFDYQQHPDYMAVITGHTSQIQQRKEQLAVFNKPIRVIEPAFQAVVRAVNFLLPYHWPPRYQKQPANHWLIVHLAAPLAVVMHCRHGDLIDIKFQSLAELAALQHCGTPVFIFGLKSLLLALREILPEHEFTVLQVPDQLAAASTTDNSIKINSGQMMPLLGLALRGFSHWHH